MTEDELRNILTDCLGDLMNRHGQILYSGIETLRPGTFYFLGFNPAADETNPVLHEVPLDRKNWSAYTQQCWYCGAERDCEDAGTKQHQTRVVGIMAELGLTPEETFATNLIFAESRTAREIYNKDVLQRCWCVHKYWLAEVMPKYVLCLGNGEDVSVFKSLREIARDLKYIDPIGQWKGFKGTFDLHHSVELRTTVIGVRHPGRPMRFDGLRSFVGI